MNQTQENKIQNQSSHSTSKKSILTFAIRPYQDDIDLQSLAKRIKTQIVTDGVSWKEWNLVQMMYGMKGIHITALVQDEASIQKLVDLIQDFSEDIQSVDLIVSRKYKGSD